jgi:hypothetical protein
VAFRPKDERFAVGFLQVNPVTMEQNDSVVGESAAPREVVDPPRPPIALLANVTTLPEKGGF